MPSTPSQSIAFRVTGLPATFFQSLFGLSDAELADHHARRVVVDHKPGYPDRIELRDAEVGESVILVNHTHLSGPGPYRASHAVFVIEGATQAFDAVGRIPVVLRSRMLSLRAFDRDETMIEADLVDGRALESLVERYLADPAVAFLHVHYAKRGCYACRIGRAEDRADA